jgi:stearoyl-CoA desaturase (Delta-9 desaturase)
MNVVNTEKFEPVLPSTVSQDMIQKRVLRTGDGSHEYAKNFASGQIVKKNELERDVEHFWGWNDEMMTAEDREDVTIINQTEN